MTIKDLERRFDKVEDNQESMKEDLGDLKVIAKVNSENLKTHIKRTDILQSRQYKIVMALVFIIGVVGTKFAPEIFRLLGFI